MALNYYVYIYLDPTICDLYKANEHIFYNKPIYVGKGKNDRYLDHIKHAEKLIKYPKLYEKYEKKLDLKTRYLVELLKNNINPIIVKLKENMEEQKSFDLEKFIIKSFGRINNNTGILTNLTDGDEGVSGRILSKSSLKKISDSVRKVFLDENYRNIHIEIMKKVRCDEEFRRKHLEGLNREDIKLKRKLSREKNLNDHEYIARFKAIMNSDEVKANKKKGRENFHNSEEYIFLEKEEVKLV